MCIIYNLNSSSVSQAEAIVRIFVCLYAQISTVSAGNINFVVNDFAFRGQINCN